MPERNELCPCGSKIKYKNCYLKNLNTCNIFMRENDQNIITEHNRKEKEVFRFFEDSTRDIGGVFAVTDKDIEVTGTRVQFVIIFTFIDILGSYYYEYQGKTGTQKGRFIEWLNKYCLTKENKNYREIFNQISAEKLYSFRSSMVHFFGLGPNVRGEGHFMLVPNDEELKKIAYNFIKNQKNKGVILFPLESKLFYDLVTQGAILMLNEWSEIINKSQTDKIKQNSHIAGIGRIHHKIMHEGAVMVEYKKS